MPQSEHMIRAWEMRCAARPYIFLIGFTLNAVWRIWIQYRIDKYRTKDQEILPEY